MTQSICLAMIVRNEAAVVERCIASVRPYITHWAIVDTGSQDETIARIRAALADLPGELIERPWIDDYAASRNQSLDLAREVLRRDGALESGYLLIVDADDALEAEPGFALPELTEDGYRIPRIERKAHMSRITVPQLHLIRAAAPFRYRAQIHEHLTLDPPGVQSRPPVHPVLPGIVYRIRHDGAQHATAEIDARTSRARIELLERLVANPDEPGLDRHYRRHLAKEYLSARRWADAERVIRADITAGLTRDGYYIAHWSLGLCLQEQRKPVSEIIAAYLAAYDARPDRSEAPFYLARVAHLLGMAAVSELFIAAAEANARHPADASAVEPRCYGAHARPALARDIAGRVVTATMQPVRPAVAPVAAE